MSSRGLGSFFMACAFVLTAVALSSAASAQERSTIGPVPPPGIDRGLRPPQRDQRVLTSVPAYIWHHGCGPTALGMIIGYWDVMGYADLVPGDADTQTAAVNAMIADDSGSPNCALPDGDHYQDYCCPRDDNGPLAPDRSQTGGAHASDCVADFMRTSWSAAENRYGWSWATDVIPAFEQYVDLVSSYGYSAAGWGFSEISWNDYMAEIDAGRPVGLLVDTDGNGGTDHFIAAIGYNTATHEYACRDTWDMGVHWFDWSAMVSGNPWGIHSAYFFTFASLAPGACCTLGQPCRITSESGCNGEGVFLGIGTDCSPDPCPDLSGACCVLTGGCSIQFGFNCVGDNTYMGPGTVCDPDPCPSVGGACCAPDGSCTVTSPNDCPQGSTFHGMFIPCDPNPCRPNPNRGGALLVHANPALAYPDPSGYLGRSGLTRCSDAITTVTGADPFVFYVIAAFNAAASPRMTSVSFGVEYDPDTVGLLEWGTCGDMEIPTGSWPSSGQGTLVFWHQPSTSRLTEVYWFAGYSYLGAERRFRLVPHPTEGSFFFDDQMPAHRDPVECLGALGFNTAGDLCCPIPQGACCHSGTLCALVSAEDCETSNGDYQGDGALCYPNPCIPSEVNGSESHGSESNGSENNGSENNGSIAFGGRPTLAMTGPNPAGDRIQFRIEVAEPVVANVSLVDVTGKLVRSFGPRSLTPGRHDLSMDTVDESGRRLPSGVYYLRSETLRSESSRSESLRSGISGAAIIVARVVVVR